MKSLQTKKAAGRRRGLRVAAAALATVGCAGVAATAAIAGSATPAQTLSTYSSQPTTIGNFPALKTAPPKGKVIVMLGTGEVSNVQVANGVAEAAKAAGWKYFEATYNAANPSSMVAALQIAIAKHASYVAEAGTPMFSAFTSLAAAHHVKILLDAVAPATVGGPVLVSTGGADVDYRMGEIAAAEFIVNSGGKGEAVEEAVPQYPILTTFADGFQAEVKADCPKCKIDMANVSISDLAAGNLPKIVVAAVQAHSSAQYIVFDDGPFADGITSALSAAGISGKKILGEAGDAAGFAAVKAGTNLAWTGYSVPFDSWEMMDAAFRNSEGLSVPSADSEQPTQIVTKANSAKITLDAAIGGWNYPTNGFQQFEKVWKVG
jgi:ribose transport system substrate-binding protein